MTGPRGAPVPLDLRAYADRFWKFVRRRGPDECWLWGGGTSGKYGYGKFAPTHRHQFQAHRFSYELAKGPIPPGLQIDHLCKRPGCVNPAHLEAVTPHENTMRSHAFTAILARRTHCPRGHPFDKANTRWEYRPGKRPNRCCRACEQAKCRAWRAKQHAAGIRYWETA